MEQSARESKVLWSQMGGLCVCKYNHRQRWWGLTDDGNDDERVERETAKKKEANNCTRDIVVVGAAVVGAWCEIAPKL